ncbi:putative Fe(2+)-trafficking protein [Arsenophonus endosymbiont of Aleurodicus dispersus]|uniref:oxidative damage protection protein n=1 Tax=Arsenophonus endosymbiont of Aleurodicus dispersus TaxID=235559 RepID=UPI000EB19064|nr:oxidative damage protection protein [Arsenophonus endosymbiont of Aleurodicus dispersus]VAY02307.1 putative Fe(2+)-trafficking protein [Arsenophonus endosymbiont of Aleurodicus dispersus]
MSRIIFCMFLQREAKGLDFILYPGEIGKYIFNQISKEAWEQWISKQTILINEKKLSTLNYQDRKLLEQEMIKFLFKGQKINI